jgi:hypothetical protein
LTIAKCVLLILSSKVREIWQWAGAVPRSKTLQRLNPAMGMVTLS